jgi:hypothetical protein
VSEWLFPALPLVLSQLTALSLVLSLVVSPLSSEMCSLTYVFFLFAVFLLLVSLPRSASPAIFVVCAVSPVVW